MLELDHKKQRAGRATSSEFFKLMGIKGLNQLGNTYALEKAIELVYGVDESPGYESYDMVLGSEREPLAFEMFSESIALNFETIEPGRFFELGKDSGGTPDGIVNGKFPWENKSPKADKYFSILRYGIEALDPAWIIQLQHQMLSMDADKGYFNLFTIYNSRPYHHYYVIEKDNSLHDKMELRLKEWVPLRDEHVSILESKL